MLKKIVLPVALLIFTQQDFYGMKGENGDKVDIESLVEVEKESIWGQIDNYFNYDHVMRNKNYPHLWWVWAFLDNVPFQYGNSRIWKHGEAYYGLSNGIGFFPSALNFRWLKIGIIDVHINVINFILDFFKNFIAKMYYEKYTLLGNILYPLCYNFVSGIHLLSFNLLNCVKIKIISIGMIIGFYTEIIEMNERKRNWYHICDDDYDVIIGYEDMSRAYLFLSPRIEINISGIINYFNGK